jgi:hypothetical protein
MDAVNEWLKRFTPLGRGFVANDGTQGTAAFERVGGMKRLQLVLSQKHVPRMIERMKILRSSHYAAK